MVELWTQFGESITNGLAFLAFFFVLKKWGWPVLKKTLDERAAKIESGFAEMRRQQSEAARLQAQFAEQMRGVEAEARARMQEALADANRVAAEISEKARKEANETIERAQRTIQLEAEKARAELRNEMVRMTVGATERLLREKLDEGGQRRLVEGFITELESRKN